nr:hypothetical protein [Gammaproteobacteria bacterium]
MEHEKSMQGTHARAAILLGICLLAHAAVAASADVQEAELAKHTLAEARSLCEADDGRLWTRSLCGPMLVVNPNSRRVWANQADSDGVLKERDGVFTGALPQGVPVANTAVDWAGRRWSMVVLPLPEDRVARRVLLAHESWHRIQDELGFAASSLTCSHLDTERGRTLLRLEMRALAQALRSEGDSRWRAARDALLFREQRHREFGDAAQTETALDRNEGLAEYTGVRLGASEAAERYAAAQLDRFDSASSYVRSYAYATGPAYGLLLDQLRPSWRTIPVGLAPAALLEAELGIDDLITEAVVAAAAARYDGAVIQAEEAQRAERQRIRTAELTQRFTATSRVVLPLQRMQMEFNPNLITTLEGLGNVYETLTVRDVWGELRAQQGALISADFKQLVVSKPSSDGLSGPGWTLSLQPSYRLREKAGVFTLEETEVGE